MKRSMVVSVVVLVVSLFVGGAALKAQAATSSAPRAVSAVQSAGETSTDSGYWAAWADAASH